MHATPTLPPRAPHTLRVARQSAIKARTQAANELHALVATAPDAMRAQLRRLKIPQLVAGVDKLTADAPIDGISNGGSRR